MKKALFFVALALTLLCCTRKPEGIRTGDLVFVGLPLDYSLDSTDMASAISASTGNGEMNLIHVAIADVVKDSVWIIDATIAHGVDRHPLDTFLADFTLKDGSLPPFMIRRVDGVDGAAAVERAKALCGLPYDVHFRPDNDSLYCTELVRECYLDASGKPVFENSPMNFRAADGSMPVYWEQLFALLGESVPQDVPGTNPQGMFADSRLVEVDVPLK